MNEEKLNKLQEVINDQLDLIEMNVARINNKDYFGLDFELLKYIRNLENQLDIANKTLDKKKEYLVQVYDEEGNACKNPRYFKGTEEEVEQYIQDRFGIVDAVYGRTTRYYETTNEEDIPQKIDTEKVSDENE